MRAALLLLLLAGCSAAQPVACELVDATPATACEGYTYDEQQWDAQEKAWLRQVLQVTPKHADAADSCRVINVTLTPGTAFAYDTATGNMLLDREQIAHASAWHVVPTKMRQERSGATLQAIVEHLAQHSMGVSHPEPETL